MASYPEAKVVEVVQVPVMALRTILLDHLPPGQSIDFLSIDVEGGELDALRSNDWHQFRPRWILAEVNQAGQAIADYLDSMGYALAFCNGLNALFADRSQLLSQSADAHGMPTDEHDGSGGLTI